MEVPHSIVCPHCNREMPNNPGAYYHKKACEAGIIREQIREERSGNNDPEVIRKLRQHLEMADYVGD